MSVSKDGKIILVTGATGQQGGAVARALLAGGWPVRALTRHPFGAASTELWKAGAEIITGNFDKRDALEVAVQGVHGVFSVQPPGFDGTDFTTADEVRQGRNIAEAAKAAGVQHFVYTSVGGADRNSAVPHFETKWAIEQHIHTIGLPATILRPVSFFELYLSPYVSLQGNVLSFVPDPETRMQHIAVEDIGIFARLVFERPSEFLGRALEIAGDELSLAEIARGIGAATGRSIQYAQYPRELFEQNPVLGALLHFIRRRGFAAEILALRTLHPGLLTFDRWLQRSAKAKFEALLAA